MWPKRERPVMEFLVGGLCGAILGALVAGTWYGSHINDEKHRIAFWRAHDVNLQHQCRAQGKKPILNTDDWMMDCRP